MQQNPIIAETLASLAQFNPKSVFMCGSRGRQEFKPESNYEIGVIFDDEKYVQRSDTHAAISNPDVKAYPFKWGELVSSTFGHVFQKSINLQEIIRGGQIIAGEHLSGQIPPPPITTLDLIQRIRFDIGMALAALLSFRAGDVQTSMEEFSKSCLFGLRCLVILELKTFPVGYDEIYELSSKVVSEPKHLAVIEAAYAQRKEGPTPNIDVLLQNISLMDSLIEPKILAAFNERGNESII